MTAKLYQAVWTFYLNGIEIASTVDQLLNYKGTNPSYVAVGASGGTNKAIIKYLTFIAQPLSEMDI